ncbi:MAG: FAD-binding protein [Erythrobacter sp.]|uniref:FAD-binding protein n=1 Tax=Erythrobacter sp. TaxID=1042 RepID=UPI002B48D39E|nr:FAD-binding protein [Erythrobacter sp.]WRH69285.1 MAG: FAD-binding protein [Erythrobacter sp.]
MGLFGSKRPKTVEGKSLVESWMGVFFGYAHVTPVASEAQLRDALAGGAYSCLGQRHSYNGIQVIPGITALDMGNSALKACTYDPVSETATCGPSLKIVELKQELLKHRRKMLNSGNYMEQTVIGALTSGTHGYGAQGVVAQSVTALTFLDGKGEPVTLKVGDADFPYAALSFGTIGPIISVTLRTAPLESYRSDAWITRLSKKAALSRGAIAVTAAYVPYSNPDDPLIMLHTLRPATPGKGPRETNAPLYSPKRLLEALLKRLWAFDRTFPAFRYYLQRAADRLDIRNHKRIITDPEDLDYLYDPDPGLKSQRPPDLLTGFFSTTFTAYNLAFFVPIARTDEVVRFIMREAQKLREKGFVLKSMISIRELADASDLPFAGNFGEPVSAIDLFSDVRDYAWLERLQAMVIANFPGVRPHWGKSMITEDFAPALGEAHIARMRALHLGHYPPGTLTPNAAVRKLFDLGHTPH